MDIKPYSQQLAQQTSHSRALATLGSAGAGSQESDRESQVTLSTQRTGGQSQPVLTYEHLAKNGRRSLVPDSDKGAVVQPLVDKALGFDRRTFNELEVQRQTLAGDRALTAGERDRQDQALVAQQEAMLREAMARLIGKTSQSETATTA